MLLAGQGAKIFSVQEILARMFSGIPVLDHVQEVAVVAGLCMYTGVLNGQVRNALLLDANYTGISVRCCAVTEVRKDYHFAISGESQANSMLFEILPQSTTIPTRKWFDVDVTRSKGGRVELQLVETSTLGQGQVWPIGTLPLSIGEAEECVLGVDVDENRTVVIWIEDLLENELRGHQLNNPFLTPYAPPPGLEPLSNYGLATGRQAKRQPRWGSITLLA